MMICLRTCFHHWFIIFWLKKYINGLEIRRKKSYIQQSDIIHLIMYTMTLALILSWFDDSLGRFLYAVMKNGRKCSGNGHYHAASSINTRYCSLLWEKYNHKASREYETQEDNGRQKTNNKEHTKRRGTAEEEKQQDNKQHK